MVDKAGDAIALWQQMVGEMQKGFGAFAKQGLAAQGPHDATDQAKASPVGPQKPLADLMENYLVGMNLPSRSQLTDMAERLQGIETQLREIKALLHQMQAASKAQQSKPQEVRPQEPRPPQARARRPAAPPEPKSGASAKGPSEGEPNG